MTKRAADAEDFTTYASLKKKSACSSIIVELDPTKHVALNLVLKQDMLHWSDAMTLGRVCKESHKLYKEHREIILSPLLKELEGMIGSNVHRYCGKVYAPQSKRVCSCGYDMDIEDPWHPCNQALAALDPRYNDDYET